MNIRYTPNNEYIGNKNYSRLYNKELKYLPTGVSEDLTKADENGAIAASLVATKLK